MASGSGYIYEWFINDVGGLIHVCAGDRLVGRDVAFPFDGCSDDLKEILESNAINDEVRCPPPNSALRVRFEFDIFEGEDLAINVRLN